MRLFKCSFTLIGGLAALLVSGAAHAQTLPTWSFQLLDGQQPANSTGTVSGNPLGTKITYVLDYTFTKGSPTAPGIFEIGGYVTETDLPTSGYAIDLGGAIISAPSAAGDFALNNDTAGQSASDFFVQNDDGTGVPAFSFASSFPPPALAAGTHESIDLGQLDVTKFLTFVDASKGPGNYVGSLDYTLSAIDDASIRSLPNITTGPPSIQIKVHILPLNNKPPPAVPEPGAVAMFAGLTLTGAGFLLRRRKK